MNTIDYPPHYVAGRKFEPIDVIEDWCLGYNDGNAVKYISRAGRKGSRLEDLYKAHWYLVREIQAEERRQNVETQFPGRLFWGDDGIVGEDEGEIVKIAEMYTVVAVHSNQAPHTRWAVCFRTSEDGDDDIDWFDDRDRAQAFVDHLLTPAPAEADDGPQLRGFDSANGIPRRVEGEAAGQTIDEALGF